MAAIEDLVAQVADPDLRMQLQAAVRSLKEHKRFGLVFEEHIPEVATIPGLPVSLDDTVTDRTDPASRLFRVTRLLKRAADLEPVGGGDIERRQLRDLQVVRRFGEPTFPALLPTASVGTRGSPSARTHSVICGENYHVLQMLLYLHEGQVDCIYIDPPYNTGAKDWKYNNHYVDSTDAWRHSKWLAMMEKRLILARRLLKPDGVLVVTIDEHEMAHLAVLLEQLFPAARLQTVSICINPSGASSDGLSRVDEYALFCWFGDASPSPLTRDLLIDQDLDVAPVNATWESLLRRGNQWYRHARPNLCYPVLLDDAEGRIEGVGDPFRYDDETARPARVNGHKAAWPVRTDGRLGIWSVDGAKLLELAGKGYAYVGSRDDTRNTWTIRYLMQGTTDAIDAGDFLVTGLGSRHEVLVSTNVVRRTVPKTMWKSSRHIAGGSGGTQLLSAMLGQRNLFPYPKSLYAVEDVLATIVGKRPDALILDFFAGSGTTLHATALLNAQDGGTRRCILVTNNEVDDVAAMKLRHRHVFPGDEEWESHGVFEAVARPRCIAAISGVRADGSTIEGSYLGGRPYCAGFAEAVEFYRLVYVDPDEVDLGWQFDSILPALWLRAGAVGERPEFKPDVKMAIPEGTNFAVLFDDSAIRSFAKKLAKCPKVTHAYLITDSLESFAEMRALLRPGLDVSMLYRDYLRSFAINIGAET